MLYSSCPFLGGNKFLCIIRYPWDFFLGWGVVFNFVNEAVCVFLAVQLSTSGWSEMVKLKLSL